MFTLWGAKQRFCDGFNRRSFLKIGVFGADAAYQTALVGAAGKAGAASAVVTSLADSAIHSLLVAKVKSVATVCVLAAALLGGIGWAGY